MADRLTQGLMSYEDALAGILDTPVRTATESVPLAQAENRVLGADIVTLLDQPPNSVSAMDGYAVLAADLASRDSVLDLVGSIAAGDPPGAKIAIRQTMRILTGAPMPEGADAVAIQENATGTGDGRVRIEGSVDPGRYVRPAAYDFKRNVVIAQKSHTLSTAGLALAAAAGHADLTVMRRPRVGIISTGNELVPPGTRPEAGQIIASNAVGVSALLRRFGADPIDLGIARDTMDALSTLITKAQGLDLDLLITLGGASVGDHDLVRPALEQHGAVMNFWKVAVRPGKPLMHGQLGPMALIGLPGNPVSSLVCSHIFVWPLIKKLLAQETDLPRMVAKLATDLPANGPRRHFMRARLAGSDAGVNLVTPLEDQDSSLLSRLAYCDMLVDVPPHNPAMKAGQMCQTIALL
ncbi:MAG: gephyrin-like molybdotransferase Glp [Pseudomonadota bacterium]